MFDDIELMMVISAALIGFAASMSGGFWGLGGGWLIVPALMMLGVDQKIAAGASLLNMIPSSSLTVFKQAPKIGWKKGGIGWRVAVPLCGAAFIGGFFGKPIGVFIKEYFDKGDIPVQILYLILLAWIAYKTLRTKKKPPTDGNSDEEFSVSGFVVAMFGFGVGCIASLLGIGGGTVTRPIMKSVLHVPEISTGQIGRLAVFIIAISGSFSYFSSWDAESQKSLIFGISLAAGGIFGFPLGAKMHEIVLKAGDDDIAHKSFALVVICVMVSLSLKLASLDQVSKIFLIISSVLLVLALLIITLHSMKKLKAEEKV